MLFGHLDFKHLGQALEASWLMFSYTKQPGDKFIVKQVVKPLRGLNAMGVGLCLTHSDWIGRRDA